MPTTLTLRRLAERLNPFAVARRRQDWVIDSVLFAVSIFGIVLTTFGMAGVFARLPDWWLPVDIAGAVIASAALWWRRRYPLLIGFLLAPLGGLFLTAGPPAVIAVYTVTAYRRTFGYLAVFAVHLIIAIGYYLVVPLTDEFLLWVVFMVLIYGTAVAFGLAARARRQVIAGLIDSAERDRNDYERQLAQVRQAERQQVAREMHDVLAHRISLLSVHAGALEYRSRAAAEQGRPLSGEELRSSVGVIRESAHRALEELRQVLMVLQADPSEAPGELGTERPQVTLAGLPELIAEARASGQVINLHELVGLDQLSDLDSQLQRTIFRTIQEGLTNARKHTPGAQVEVELAGVPGREVVIMIGNQLPVGATEAEIPGAGVGLTGLAERVRLDGGRLSRTVSDGRFVLTARLPWRT
ncbi:sensor histidine kinase [Microlunatus parietis]|uniref:histidine kinase n=1 Tax=Microlunatus parietis TaxID=682979 RepID=A0A7Y9I747_9ACTN|nr:histidine kinase [Microlunatus parietis]NYE71480.1 signal transduction histidine kinase [Microlunatus parietis]